MLGAWSVPAFGASALSPSTAQCQRLTSKLAKVKAKGGRYVFGIRTGSGSKLKAKRDAACAAAAAVDPTAAFEAAYAQGEALVPVAEAPQSSTPLLIAGIVGTVLLVGVGALVLSGGRNEGGR